MKSLQYPCHYNTFMCLAQGPQRSDAGEALTRSLSISSQALYTQVNRMSRSRRVLAIGGKH